MRITRGYGSLNGGHRNRLYRTALVVVSVLLPALAIAYRLGAPEHADPTAQRFGFAVVALGLAAASLRSSWVARHLGALTLCFLSVLGLWVVYYAADSGLDYPDLVGMTVFQFALLVVFPELRFARFTMTGWIAATAGALWWLGGDALAHPAFALGLPIAMAVTGLFALREREALVERIEASHAALEERVRERTRALSEEVERRREAERRAQQGNEAKSRFLLRMSHELRTPINAIVGYTEMAEEELRDELPTAEALGDLARVRTASAHLLRLVDDVLDVSRIEAGTLELHASAFSLGELAEEVVDRRRVAEGQDVDLCVEAAAEVVADRGRVAQVLDGLLENAQRFAPGTACRVAIRAGEGTGLLTVQDEGPGVDVALQEHVFESFTQGDERAVRSVDGAGLGLALGRQLARRMGGDLQLVPSAVGATFALTLPSPEQ